MKRIVCLGGGPGGLYAAILFKKALPGASVEVYERNRPDDTFGWGVVFSDQTLQGFHATDPESHDAAGGAGLVVTEMTCVSPTGRISPGCTGLWNDTQRDAWKRIVDFVHAHSAAKFSLQLLASFLSPLTNRRDDEFGGDIENRMRFPLRVFKAVRAVWPADKPMSVRISAHDWAEGGLTEQDLVAFARALREAGADLIDVSTGQTVPWQKPVYGRMYQTPFSDLLRNSVDIATIAVGNIFEADHVNSIIAAGRADLCALARPQPRRSVVDAACRRGSELDRAALAEGLSVGQEPTGTKPRARRANDWCRLSTNAQPLAGKHALVTGASRGIGVAIAQRLLAEGAQVTLLGRQLSAVTEMAAKLSGSNAYAVAADVSNGDQMRAAIEEASDRCGPIDILVNNAGQAASAPVHKMDEALWHTMLSVNLTGTYFGIRHVLPSMLQRDFGRIVNIASTAGLKGYPYVAAYSAAKHGVIGLTRSLALEVAGRNITVNAVCPGYTDTDIVRETIRNIQAKTGRSEVEALAVLVDNNPQRRLNSCAEVANAVAWLCLPGTESITGQSIAVAGGEVT